MDTKLLDSGYNSCSDVENQFSINGNNDTENNDNNNNNNNSNNNDQFYKKVELIKSKTDATKQQMLTNLDKVIERGENIDLLAEKADNLSNHATLFGKQSRRLRQYLCRENCKKNLVIAIIFGTLLTLFIVVIIALSRK